MTTFDVSCVHNGRVAAATLFVLLAGTACVPFDHAPRQIQASNPTVTYTYHDDNELIQTNQLAATFCSRYQNAAQPVRFSTDGNGDRVVVFECMPASTPNAPYSNSNLTYTVRTDKEMMDASRDASVYCSNSGSPHVVSNVISNGNGTRTVTFQCHAS